MARPEKYGHEPELRQKPTGIWEAVWRDRFSGDLQRRTTGERDRMRALTVLHVIAAEVSVPSTREVPTVSVLIDRYIKAKELDSTDPHKVQVLRASLRPVAAKLGHLTSDQLSQDHIDEYARQRLAQRRWEGDKRFEGKETGTVGQSTVDKDLRMLRACLNDAMRRRYIPAALPFKIASPDFAARDEWLTPGEVERMLDLCERRTVEGTKKTVWLDRNYLRGFILISAATGARKSAVLSLKWDQVYIPRPEDVPKGELVYNFATDTAGGRPYIDFGTAVGNKHRPTFPIGHSPALLRWLLFEADRESEYVITRHGKPLADVKKGLAALLADAGISKDVTPHSLKHTAITWMVQANVPFSTIADLTKTSEKILKKHYSHHRPDYHAQLAELPRLNA